MPGFFASLILLFTTLTPVAAKAEIPAQLDMTAIKQVTITGESSRMDFTTIDTVPYTATITGTRTSWLASWYSSWFSNSCDTKTTTEIKDQALTINVVETPLLSISDCEVRIIVNLPEGADINIEQHALLAHFSGQYRSIRINGNTADFSLDGYVSTLDIKGDAVRSDMRFDRTSGNETIRLDSHALDASFNFLKGTPISYAVKANASFIDSKLANTPGAKPSIDITSDYVRATIR
ncbi:hypothetical protein [Phyllobacterium sp. SB3]|uniref:hypothetical protein n=1 Tax=Phyllobacterium sp. SB3 TaxID=3156073 RepID=UPI0032AF6622